MKRRFIIGGLVVLLASWLFAQQPVVPIQPSVTDLLTRLIVAVQQLQPNQFGPAQKVYQSFPAASWDTCNGPNRTRIPVSTNANAQLIAGQGGKTFHFCGGVLVATTAGSASIVEGTGATCGTGTLAVIGATTAANGVPMGATAGFLINGGGTVVAGDNVCILLTGTGIIAGNLEYGY